MWLCKQVDYATLPSYSETNYITFMALLSFSDPAHLNHCWEPVEIISGVNSTIQTPLEQTESKKKKNHTADKVHRGQLLLCQLKSTGQTDTTISCKICFYVLAKTASKDSHLCMKLCSHLDEKNALHFLTYNHHCSNICSFLQYSRILHFDHTTQTPHIHRYLKIQRKIYALRNRGGFH